MKICNQCKQLRPLSEYNKDRTGVNGLSGRCRSCKRAYEKEYEATHKEAIAKRKKAYLQRPEVKARDKAYHRVYNQSGRNNMERINAYRRKHQKQRYAIDPVYKLRALLRTRLNMAIDCGCKGGSAVRDLGCSLVFFKGYIEGKFQEGMTWENRGLGKGCWHLDHVVPLKAFDLTDREQFLKAHHYTNYQPLWSIENILKSDYVCPNG